MSDTTKKSLQKAVADTFLNLSIVMMILRSFHELQNLGCQGCTCCRVTKDIPQKKLPNYMQFDVSMVVNVMITVILGCDVV